MVIDDWSILVVVVPMAASGLLGMFAAKRFSRINSVFLGWLHMPPDFIESTSNVKLIRFAGFIAFLGSLLVLTIWIGLS
jgi:hypothetical protein